MVHDAASLRSEFAVAPKANLNRLVSLFTFAKNRDYRRNVAARPPADCQDFHILSPYLLNRE
jgi:hypothetical protein